MIIRVLLINKSFWSVKPLKNKYSSNHKIFYLYICLTFFLGAVNASGFHDGEEFCLTKNGKEIFKGQYRHCSSDTTIHGEVIGKENGRFSINKLLKNASEWTDFDSDKHANDAAVKWSLKSLCRIKKESLLAEGTESKFPMPLAQ